jgi:hypothetical protein
MRVMNANAHYPLQREVAPQEKQFLEEINRYIDDAESGARDWVEWDSTLTADALIAVFKILNGREFPPEKIAQARSVMAALICRAAREHSQRALDNGMLE